jgi:hypothetical protein
MRKLEGVVKEIVDELGYLEEREQRFAHTNSMYPSLTSSNTNNFLLQSQQTNVSKILRGSLFLP